MTQVTKNSSPPLFLLFGHVEQQRKNFVFPPLSLVTAMGSKGETTLVSPPTHLMFYHS